MFLFKIELHLVEKKVRLQCFDRLLVLYSGLVLLQLAFLLEGHIALLTDEGLLA